jgi:hypothetical protein
METKKREHRDYGDEYPTGSEESGINTNRNK